MKTQGKDSCGGDSGGPLIIKSKLGAKKQKRGILIGLVCYGYNSCGTRGLPSVYTNVTHYLNWILDNIDDDEEDPEENHTSEYDSDEVYDSEIDEDDIFMR